MISLQDRQNCIELIQEAVTTGAALNKACNLLNVHQKTYRRWVKIGTVQSDSRPNAKRPEPGNRLAEEERELIIAISNGPKYKALPPSQIVPKLADEGIYIASESTFYRVLKAAKQWQHRGKSLAPKNRRKSNSYLASGPNEVWSWDITYLKSNMTGMLYRLYMLLDIYNRKIVGWEVHETEPAEFASMLINRACLAESACRTGLVLHSDNGGPMKGATMLAKLQWLDVVPSFSRPSVSNDNPYSESLFKTLKYTPVYPEKPFASLLAARDWVHTFVEWYNEEH